MMSQVVDKIIVSPDNDIKILLNMFQNMNRWASTDTNKTEGTVNVMIKGTDESQRWIQETEMLTETDIAEII